MHQVSGLAQFCDQKKTGETSHSVEFLLHLFKLVYIFVKFGLTGFTGS